MTAAIRDMSFVDIRHQMGQDGKDPVREAAAQFEALFIQTLMKNMREASLGEGIFDSEQHKLYQGMLDQQFAIKMASGEGIGIAEMLARQLGAGDSTTATHNAVEVTGPVFPASGRVAGTYHSGPAAEAGNKPAFDSPESFVRELWPHVKKVASELGVEARSVIAQAALETGWGKYVPKNSDGTSSLNFFGIKADKTWNGDSVTKTTLEFDGETLSPETGHFRAYDSVAESVRDYLEFLTSNPRYEAVGSTDGSPEAFGRSLSDTGYATDPEYAAKIARVATSERMDQLIDQLEGAEPLIGAAGAAASP